MTNIEEVTAHLKERIAKELQGLQVNGPADLGFGTAWGLVHWVLGKRYLGSIVLSEYSLSESKLHATEVADLELDRMLVELRAYIAEDLNLVH